MGIVVVGSWMFVWAAFPFTVAFVTKFAIDITFAEFRKLIWSVPFPTRFGFFVRTIASAAPVALQGPAARRRVQTSRARFS